MKNQERVGNLTKGSTNRAMKSREKAYQAGKEGGKKRVCQSINTSLTDKRQKDMDTTIVLSTVDQHEQQTIQDMYRPTLAIQKIGDYSSDEEVQTSLRKACKKRKKKPSLPGNARIKSPTSRENEVVIIEHFNTSSEERDEKRSSKNYTNIFCTEIYSGENEGTRSTKSLIKQSNILAK